jgi:microcystin-dependent protein
MEEPFLAEIRFVPAGFVPEGWAWCNGQELLIEEHPALFELLGTTYGGDGHTTFALPNLVGRKPIQLETHFVNTTLVNQYAGSFGLVNSTVLHHKTQPYQATYFCIALQGVFPVSSKKC